MIKGGTRRTGRAFLGEEQAHESELRSEEDGVWWSKGKRGLKGSSKGHKSFRKGGTRSCPYEKARARFKNAREVPIHRQDSCHCY